MLLPAIVILVALRKSRGTTLFAPLAWALLAYVVVSLTAISLLLKAGPVPGNWIYIAATSTFCPIISLFGAKRPQNRAWQLIVFAFWFITALPAIQSLMMRPGEGLELHSVWKWFLVILILVGGINYLPTRFAWASLLITSAQVLLFWNYLPKASQWQVVIEPVLGMITFMLGIGIGFWSSHRTRRRLAQFHGWNRVWRDFRDFYGVVWALRIMERVNSLSSSSDLQVRLHWDGFYETRPQPGHSSCDSTVTNNGDLNAVTSDLANSVDICPASPDAVAPLDAALRNLLRRFVSNDWLESRLQNEHIGQEIS